MDRIDLFRIFIRVVDCTSFTRAADTLTMPRSSVSAAIQELEGRVGARLLHRTTRKVTPTQDGLAFYERCQQLVADVEETENLFRQTAARPSGKLRVDVPGRADCVLRVGPLDDSSLIARPLGELALINVASPAYLSHHGTPRTLDDLRNHLAVNYASPTSGRVEGWEWIENGVAKMVAMRGRVTVNSAEAYIACCLAGLGLIQIPAYDVRRHLDAGDLVDVLENHRAAPLPLTLLYPHREHLSRRLNVFAVWLESLLKRDVLRPL